MRKSDFHRLAQFVPVELIDEEIGRKLDELLAVAKRAKPVGGGDGS
jgi:hypothetical protein